MSMKSKANHEGKTVFYETKVFRELPKNVL